MKRFTLVLLTAISFAAQAQTPVSQGSGSRSVTPWYVQGATSATAAPLNVSLPAYQRSAFGGVLVEQDTPVVSLSFNYNINTYFLTTDLLNGGTVTQSNGKAVLQTSANAAGFAHFHSKAGARYTPGQGIIERFTGIFSPCTASSQQEIGVGDEVDGFFFACQNATFGVIRRQNSVDTFTAQTAWNADRMNGAGGSLNPSGQTLAITNGNVYVIEFQWLGFGAIRFFVENSVTGTLQLVHTIQYANLNTNPSVFNPTLPAHALIKNTGNATNLTLQTASMGIYIEGPIPDLIGSNGSAGNNKTVASETSIITIRNNATFQSKTNRVRVKLKFLNTLTAADSIIRVLLNTTLGGTPSFTDFDTATSPMSFDTAGTTVTGGRQIMRLTNAKATLGAIDLDPLEIRLNPGDTMTFTSSTGASDINIMWFEEFGG